MFGDLVGNLVGTLYVLMFQFAGISLMFKILKEETAAIRLLLGSDVS